MPSEAIRLNFELRQQPTNWPNCTEWQGVKRAARQRRAIFWDGLSGGIRRCRNGTSKCGENAGGRG
jgi:hypothetical protein